MSHETARLNEFIRAGYAQFEIRLPARQEIRIVTI